MYILGYNLHTTSDICGNRYSVHFNKPYKIFGREFKSNPAKLSDIFKAKMFKNFQVDWKSFFSSKFTSKLLMNCLLNEAIPYMLHSTFTYIYIFYGETIYSILQTLTSNSIYSLGCIHLTWCLENLSLVKKKLQMHP